MLRGYPTPISRGTAAADKFGRVVVPLQLVTEAGKLSFLSTTTVLGTPVDMTVSELAIESFFLADDAVAQHRSALSLFTKCSNAQFDTQCRFWAIAATSVLGPPLRF
jgi:hypothetical protein